MWGKELDKDEEEVKKHSNSIDENFDFDDTDELTGMQKSDCLWQLNPNKNDIKNIDSRSNPR